MAGPGQVPSPLGLVEIEVLLKSLKQLGRYLFNFPLLFVVWPCCCIVRVIWSTYFSLKFNYGTHKVFWVHAVASSSIMIFSSMCPQEQSKQRCVREDALKSISFFDLVQKGKGVGVWVTQIQKVGSSFILALFAFVI